MKWTEDETVKFTQLYRKNECLWNVFSPSYKNKIKRHKAIEKIVNEMRQCFPLRFLCFCNSDVKQKIKNLRSTYNQELSKMKNAKSNTDELYVPSLKWFVFMDVIMKHSRGSINVQSATVDDWADNLHDFDRKKLNENEQACFDPNPQINYEAVPQASVLTKQNNIHMEGKSIKRNFPDLLCAVKELRAASKVISLSQQNMSENEAFGNYSYVAKSLDMLNPCEAIMCQQEIQAVITNYRLDHAHINFDTEVT